MDSESSVIPDISADEKEADAVSVESSSIITGGTTMSLGLPNISPLFGTFSGVVMDRVSVVATEEDFITLAVDEVESGVVIGFVEKFVTGLVSVVVADVVAGVVAGVVTSFVTKDTDGG